MSIAYLVVLIVTAVLAFVVGAVAESASKEVEKPPTDPKQPPQWEYGEWQAGQCCKSCRKGLSRASIDKRVCGSCGCFSSNEENKLAKLPIEMRSWRYKTLGDHKEIEFKDKEKKVETAPCPCCGEVMSVHVCPNQAKMRTLGEILDKMSTSPSSYLQQKQKVVWKCCSACGEQYPSDEGAPHVCKGR